MNDGLGNALDRTMEPPILMNHEHDKQIGVMREQDGKLFVEFLADRKNSRVQWSLRRNSQKFTLKMATNSAIWHANSLH